MGATPHDQAADPFRLLFVCTANRCRSPMAEYLAQRSLAERQIGAKVVSAGRLDSGAHVSPGAQAAMARGGIYVSSHISARHDPETLSDADLVLVMERSHLTDVYQTQPDALDHAFTLGEFPALLDALPDDQSDTNEAGPAQRARRRVALAHLARDPQHILIDDDSTDIVDPIGRRNMHYRRTAKQLEGLIEASIDRLFA